MIPCQASQAHLLVQQLAERSYRKTQRFLWQGCDVVVPGTFALVYGEQLTSETYQKIIVCANGAICCSVTLPTLLVLGEHHVRGALHLHDNITLMMMYNNDTQQPENAWWASLSKQAICGDIVFARLGDNLDWQANKLTILVAKALACAK